jgi:TP901 family phage tail tape measure protein
MAEKISIIVGATDKFSGVFGKLTSRLPSLTKLVTATAVAFTALGAKAVHAFGQYEEALTDLGKVTSESLDSIHKKMMDLPPVLGSSTELVKGYYQVISAGVTDPKEAMETLTVAAKAAKAAHVDQSEVIKGLTKVMAGYGGEIKSVTEASDLLFAIEKEGQTSFQELIPVIGGLAKVSADLDVESKEMAASLALITQTAGNTEEAATQYRAIMIGLMKPTEAMKATIKGMGYESAQAAIQQIGLAKTLKGLTATTGGSAEKMAELFANQRALIGVSALAANNFETLNEKTIAMSEGAGMTEKAFADWSDTLVALWGTAKNSLGSLLILIGKEFAPIASRALKSIIGFLEQNRVKIVEYATTFASAMGTVLEVGSRALPYLNRAFLVLQGTWQVLKMSFADLSIALWEGMQFLVEKYTQFLEVVNIGGAFDRDIELAKGFTASISENIDALTLMSQTAQDELARIAGDPTTVENVESTKQAITDAMAEIKLSGTEEPTGIYPFDSANVAVTAENLEALKTLHDEHFLSESEKLTLWYETELAKYEGNEEAKLALTEVYLKKRTVLQSKIDKDALKGEKTQQSGLNAIAKAGSLKGFGILKAAAIPEIWTATETGAISAYKAMAGIPVIGPALGKAAALAVKIYGAARMAKVAGLSVAHGGLDYVPKEQTMLVDKGERILSPNQNQDLIEFMGKGGGESIAVENFFFQVPVTFDEIKRMDREDWRDLAEDKIIPALRDLATAGIKV